MGPRHSGHCPYFVLSTGIPFGCGGSILGGGTAGPSGDVVRERAGEPGEYHHSRNLMKNIAVGRRSRRESKRSRGDERMARRIMAKAPFLCLGEGIFEGVRLACRYMHRGYSTF